jgi:hypothetical protein
VPSFKLVAEEPRDVPALGLLGVEPGDVVDVSDKALCEGLAGQSDVWEPVTKRSTAKNSQEG